ncbi:copper homeostasis membrane protein CopD [Pseudomonas lundensis]|uniref:copper homeostasis membrane protein CopD n=1 Tax=Pseudomonas lundensis TaxID=86185 RepID=UPI0006539FCC|nr:copper homeostasis membrane protein CopD [Pseudomonas lundensis]KMM85060.1 copper resistance protein CopD [Pseudomonas lundensis]
MSDSINIVVRFALYFDLMLLFGLAIFGLYSLRGKERVSGTALNFESLLYGTSVAGVALSLVAMLLLAKAMSGVSELMELHHHIFEMVLMGTDVGLTWMVRIAVLVMAIIGVALNKRFPTPSLWIVTVCGAIALATLAWTGHGAMDEGSRRYWHFITDIFHLLAAGGWLGALLAFALLLRLKSLKGEQEARILARVLTGFESAGAVIVVIISITGVVNYLFVIGPNLDEVMLSTYGQLLFLKILLFAGMIVLATLNRFHLSPVLERSVRNGEYSAAVNALRRSMTLEFLMAVVIICLVAWLGNLRTSLQLCENPRNT